MRKTSRRINPAPQFTRRVLQLSQETVRMLSQEQLSMAASGCPTGSWPTTVDQKDSGAC